MGNNRVKKNTGWIILGVIGIIVLIPLGVAFMLSFRFIITDTTNEWIGFWGGYLGSILGGVITLFVLWKTLREEKNARDREERINYFNNIIHIWSELARTTYNLRIYLFRCKAERGKQDNDLIEKICVEEDKVVALKIELEIMLETRKGMYEVEDLLKEVNKFGKCVEETTDAFEEAKELSFENEEKNNYAIVKTEDLKDNIEYLTKNMKDTIARNLY